MPASASARLTLRSVTALAALGAAFAAPAPAAAKTTILFNVFVPPTHLIRTAIVDEWAKRVEAASNGSIRVKVPAKTLAPPPRQWGMVADGIADATVMLNAFERRRLTLIQMANLPLTNTDAEAGTKALWRTQQKHFAKAGQYKGVKLLGFLVLAPGDIHSLNKPIDTVADFDSMKIRVSPGIAAKAAAAIGAVPVPTPGVKAYEVVSKGVVDGLVMQGGELVPFKMVPFVKHTILVPGGIYNATFSMIMNQKKFDGLTDAEEKAVMDASGERIGDDAAAFDAQTPKGIAALKANGATVKTAEGAFLANLRARLTPIQKEWIAQAKKAGVDGEAALQYYVEQGKALAGEK